MNIDLENSIIIQQDNTTLAAAMLQKFISRDDRVGQAVEPISVTVTGQDEILTKLQKHLSGELRLGLYDLLPDGTVQWAVVEFENHGDAADEDIWLADALKYQQWLTDHQIPSLLERSKNPNGQCYHLHLRFNDPLKAGDVREGLRSIGREVFGSFPNEIFPKSDSGLGNFIWLPLFGGKDNWGLGIHEDRTVFLDGTGSPCSESNDMLANWQSADRQHFTDCIPRFLPTREEAGRSKSIAPYEPPEELNTKEELDRMLKFDPFIRWCQEHAAAGINEPLWYAMISNLCRFSGGRELIHQISSLDPVAERYDPAETDAKIQHALESSGPIGYEEIVHRGWQGVVPNAPLSPAGWAKIGRIQNRKPLFPSNKNPDIYLEHDDWIIVDNNSMKSAVPFADLKHKVKEEGCTIVAVCPFCDHGGATIRANTFHFAYLHCDQCNRCYWEHPDSPELFTYNGDLLRVEMKGDRFISHEKLKAVNFRTNEEWIYACQKVMNDPKRRFIGDSFTINRIGSADFGQLGYQLNPDDNAVVFMFPAVPVQVQDNSLIDDFLDNMFGKDSGFIKDWMALYAFTNYVSLPVIVLTGPRSCGKNTFADLVGEIFPTLKATWDGDKEQFNDFAVKKLVFVDENRNSEKPTQYAEIKRLTGNRIVKVNEKHIRQYYVRNNTKFIFATNDPRPIALHWREEPDSSKTNNFFIYSCPAVPVDKIDRELFDKLRARLGYYVRTELKKRYEAWRLSGGTSSRYALETPITDLARKLFGSSKSLIEMEAEELAQHLVCGIHHVDCSSPYPKTIYFSPTTVDGSLFVQQQDLRELIQKLNFKGIANYKAYITALQDQGVLSHRNNHRISNQRLGYQILRSPDYYTATDSGVLPEEEVRDSTVSRNAILEVPSISSDTRIFE